MKYSDILYNTWNPKWKVDEIFEEPKDLLRFFGDAMEDLLKVQLKQEKSREIHASQTLPHEIPMPKIWLSKTPSVKNINHFFDFFPDSYLILLVRDGRAVVESGVKSFAWDYEEAMRRWRDSAQTVIEFRDNHNQLNQKFVLVRYEDLVLNEKETLIRIFKYLNLDPEVFDFEKASSIGIVGSSESKKTTGEVHWKPTARTTNFKPIERFSNWNASRHERFNWIAGEQMTALGYKLKEHSRNQQTYIVKNSLIDTGIVGRQLLRQIWTELAKWLRNAHRFISISSRDDH